MARFREDFDDEDDDWDDDDWDSADRTRNCLSEQVHAILNHAEYMELLTLDPHKGKAPRRRGKDKTFHGWPILGLTVLTDEAAQHELVAALIQGLADWSGELSECAFEPGYAFRAEQGERTADVLICFSCQEVAVYLDDNEAEWLHLSARPTTARIFDTIYRAAGLPRA